MRLQDLHSISEARYSGNIGMIEMFKFYEVATAEEKQQMRRLITAHKDEEAWAFLQRVTKLTLA
jgi:hypothetical protein